MRHSTMIVLGVCAVFLIVWDIIVYVRDKKRGLAYNSPSKGSTISEVFGFLSKRPIVPFLFGVIMGHLFWPQTPADDAIKRLCPPAHEVRVTGTATISDGGPDVRDR
jgi:hypothetical protein